MYDFQYDNLYCIANKFFSLKNKIAILTFLAVKSKEMQNTAGQDLKFSLRIVQI